MFISSDVLNIKTNETPYRYLLKYSQEKYDGKLLPSTFILDNVYVSKDIKYKIENHLISWELDYYNNDTQTLYIKPTAIKIY
jgi:hypothetical protein